MIALSGSQNGNPGLNQWLKGNASDAVVFATLVLGYGSYA
jgi:hypothetical protein